MPGMPATNPDDTVRWVFHTGYVVTAPQKMVHFSYLNDPNSWSVKEHLGTLTSPGFLASNDDMRGLYDLADEANGDS